MVAIYLFDVQQNSVCYVGWYTIFIFFLTLINKIWADFNSISVVLEIPKVQQT